MQEFDCRASAEKPLTHESVHVQSCIHEYKGQQNLLIEVKVDMLSHLLETVRIQSTEASNRIEGVFTSNERIQARIGYTAKPQ